MPGSAVNVPQESPPSGADSRVTVRDDVSTPEPLPSLPSPSENVTAPPKYGAVAPVSVIVSPVGADESGVSANGALDVAPAPFVATTSCEAASFVEAFHV